VNSDWKKDYEHAKGTCNPEAVLDEASLLHA